MKKSYQSPVLVALSPITAECVLTASEESFDINVSFDALWC